MKEKNSCVSNSATFICAAIISASALVWPLAGPAASQTQTPLRGDMFIAGKTLSDPPPGEAKNTHVYMTITGAAAMRMYRGMRGRAKEDACRGDGWQQKSAGQVACVLSPDRKKAECDFSLSLVNGRAAYGRIC